MTDTLVTNIIKVKSDKEMQLIRKITEKHDKLRGLTRTVLE